jgi:hypothetical protein
MYFFHCSEQTQSATKRLIVATFAAMNAERRYDSPSASAFPELVAATTSGVMGPVGTARK